MRPTSDCYFFSLFDEEDPAVFFSEVAAAEAAAFFSSDFFCLSRIICAWLHRVMSVCIYTEGLDDIRFAFRGGVTFAFILPLRLLLRLGTVSVSLIAAYDLKIASGKKYTRHTIRSVSFTVLWMWIESIVGGMRSIG